MSDQADTIPETTITLIALIIVCGIIFYLIRSLRGDIARALLTMEGVDEEKATVT